MGNHTRDKVKQLPVAYFQKIYIVPIVFLSYYNAFPCVLKDVDIIIFFFAFNQLELTNSVNFRMLSLP